MLSIPTVASIYHSEWEEAKKRGESIFCAPVNTLLNSADRTLWFAKQSDLSETVKKRQRERIEHTWNAFLLYSNLQDYTSNDDHRTIKHLYTDMTQLFKSKEKEKSTPTTHHKTFIIAAIVILVVATVLSLFKTDTGSLLDKVCFLGLLVLGMSIASRSQKDDLLLRIEDSVTHLKSLTRPLVLETIYEKRQWIRKEKDRL